VGYYTRGELDLGKIKFKELIKKINPLKLLKGKGGGDDGDGGAAPESCPPGSHTVEGMGMIGCGPKDCPNCGYTMMGADDATECEGGICPYTGKPPISATEYTVQKASENAPYIVGGIALLGLLWWANSKKR